MKSSIKLKYNDTLNKLLDKPLELATLIQIAFVSNEKTGVAEMGHFSFNQKALDNLIIWGLVKLDGLKLSIADKRVVDFTLKKKPSKQELDNQLLNGDCIVPIELEEYYKITKAFQDLFLKNIKQIKGRTFNIENAKFSKWVNPIRLMIENDKVTIEQLKEIWVFLNTNDFWRDKVQSTEKLRKKFSTLYNQLKADVQYNKSKDKKGAKVSKDYLERVVNDLK